MIILHNLLAGLAHIQSIITKHTVDNNQLLVINLQDITDTERILKDLLAIELLAQVDVTDLQTVIGCGIKELADILTADNITLSQ